MAEKVTIADVRAAGFCVSGVRHWFAGRKMDFRDFIKNGIPLETVVEIDDNFTKQVLAAREKRISKGRA